MKYDWIFFDLDNTLMDFNNASKKAFSSAFLEYGLREVKGHYEVYEEVNTSAWKDFENGKIDAFTLKKKRFDDFFLTANIKGIDGREFNALYLNYLVEHSYMLDGAIELLEILKGKVQKAIITNGFKEVQRPRIKRLDLEKYFPVIVVSDEENVSKPDSAYFDIVMNLCDNPPKEKILIVGDSLNSDMKGGINYGIDTCWCNLFGHVNTTQLSPLQRSIILRNCLLYYTSFQIVTRYKNRNWLGFCNAESPFLLSKKSTIFVIRTILLIDILLIEI